MQKAALATTGVPVTWSPDVSALAGATIIIANEFFDALPVAQWIMTGGRYEERCIVIDRAGHLAFADELNPAPESAPSYDLIGKPTITPHQTTPEGSIRESISTTVLLETLGALARTAPMAMVVIDYGHEKSAFGDTLQAVRNHAHEHPLTSPGEADLSAQVDFADIARKAAAGRPRRRRPDHPG